jgi:large subunit ribosomal protein L29
MKAAKFREQSLDELGETLNELRTHMFNMRLGNTTRELQDTSKIRQLQRDIARVMTVLHEKQEIAGTDD